MMRAWQIAKRHSTWLESLVNAATLAESLVAVKSRVLCNEVSICSVAW